MVAANKLAGIVICISKDHFRDGKKAGLAQLSCRAVKIFNYSSMLMVRFNLSVRIPLSTTGIYHAHKAI